MNTQSDTTSQELSDTDVIAQLTRAVQATASNVAKGDVDNALLFPLYVLSTKMAEAKKEIDSLIFERLSKGEKIKNLVLSKPATTRVIDNIPAAYKALCDFISTEDVFSCCTIKFQELFKVFRKKYRTAEDKPLTEEQSELVFLEHLEDLVSFRTSKPSVKYKPEL